MEKAETELEEAVREHDKTVAAIEHDLAAVQRRADAEQERWEKLKERLETALRKQAGDGPSGGASLCRDLTLLWLIAAFFIDKVEEMRGGARVA